jgi:hypothetical protein
MTRITTEPAYNNDKAIEGKESFYIPVYTLTMAQALQFSILSCESVPTTTILLGEVLLLMIRTRVVSHNFILH